MEDDEHEQLWPPAPPCPQCGSEEVVSIMYGLPNPEGEELQRAGKLVFGGCCVDDRSPVWYCRGCKRRFGRRDEWLRQCVELNPELAGELVS